jgi:hypothetical protein
MCSLLHVLECSYVKLLLMYLVYVVAFSTGTYTRESIDVSGINWE